MAELVDARDSKSRDREVMGVRFPLPAPAVEILSLILQILTENIRFLWWYFCVYWFSVGKVFEVFQCARGKGISYSNYANS
jgi:hypothetical protein